MKQKIKLTQAVVHELLDYEPFTGRLTWRRRNRKWFDSDGAWEYWNATYANKSILTTNYGYVVLGILGQRCFAHRIIWLWMTGRWPDPQIDHKNRKPADNRWCNLCEATNKENGHNQSLNKNNTSGHAGVFKRKSGKFGAEIKVNGRVHRLGTFTTFEQAVSARKAAQCQHGFSESHGAALD